MQIVVYTTNTNGNLNLNHMYILHNIIIHTYVHTVALQYCVIMSTEKCQYYYVPIITTTYESGYNHVHEYSYKVQMSYITLYRKSIKSLVASYVAIG